MREMIPALPGNQTRTQLIKMTKARYGIRNLRYFNQGTFTWQQIIEQILHLSLEIDEQSRQDELG